MSLIDITKPALPKKQTKAQKELRTWLCAVYECAKGPDGVLSVTLLFGLAHLYAAMGKSPFNSKGLVLQDSASLKALNKLVTNPPKRAHEELIITKLSSNRIIVERNVFPLSPTALDAHIQTITELLEGLAPKTDIETWLAGTIPITINSCAQPSQIRSLVEYVARYDLLRTDSCTKAMKLFPAAFKRIVRLYIVHATQLGDRYIEQLEGYLDEDPDHIFDAARRPEAAPVFGLNR